MMSTDGQGKKEDDEKRRSPGQPRGEATAWRTQEETIDSERRKKDDRNPTSR